MLLAKNKKALFNNEIIEKYTAGVVLKGYEVKAIKEHHVDFEGAFISVDEDGSAFVKNLHISKYSKQSQEHNELMSRAPRRLLLNRFELRKIQREISEKGKTAVPLALIMHHNRIKLEFAVVRGRKKFEKKQLLKSRQAEIDLRRETKQQGFL